MLYEFELSHNTAEAAKNFSCTKGEEAVTRWLKKICLSYKNLNDQSRSSRPRTVNSEAVLQAIDANSASSTRRVSGEFSISQSSVVCQLHVTKILQNFWFTQAHNYYSKEKKMSGGRR